MPCGRGGAGGASPAAIRSDQSTSMSRPASRPKRVTKLFINEPRWPRCTRSSQAERAESKSSRSGISRVRWLPTWWQRWQPFRLLIHSLWLPISGSMPLPSGPVPGNSCAAGSSMSDSQ